MGEEDVGVDGVVDLRSDTVTRPTEGMRRAMNTADVGDDVYGEDPSVNELEEHVSARFGRGGALFVPSGTMANVIAMRTWARPGTEVVVEQDAHVVAYEDGASALFAGVQFRTLVGTRGQLDAVSVDAALRPRAFPYTSASAIAVENTTNRAGGTVYALETLRRLREVADRAELAIYMDGARLFNAVAASGHEPSDYAAVVDGLAFCVSKGLGAPVGSLLVGNRDAIAEARRWRRRLGGAMRQAGMLAAAGLYALRHHVDRLVDDHAHARLIAETIAADVPEAVDVDSVETNIVYVDTGRQAAADVGMTLLRDGVLVGTMGSSALRLVTHLDVDEAGCRRAAKAIVGALQG